MPFGRTLVDPELSGDLSIREPLADEESDLGLSLGQGWSSGPASVRKTEKTADLADEGIDVADEREMRSSRESDEARAFDTRSDELALLQWSGAIIFSVQHQRWRCNLIESIGHVHFVTPDEELRCRLCRGRLALVLGESSARRSRGLRSEEFCQDI